MTDDEPGTTRLRTTFCPYCTLVLDAATGTETHAEPEVQTVLNERRPTPGAFSICIGCLGMLRFDSKMVLRPLSRAAFARACAEDSSLRDRMLRVVGAMAVVHENRGRPPKSIGPLQWRVCFLKLT